MAREHIARLLLKHQDLLRDYIRGLVRDPHVAEDLFQEVGVRVLSDEGLPETPEEFVRWCRGVARNLLLHHWRSARRAKERHGQAMRDAVDRAFDEAHEEVEYWTERRTLLAECLKQLPEHARSMLKGHYVEGRPLAELAAEAGRSEAALKMALLRVRQALKACVQGRLKGAKA